MCDVVKYQSFKAHVVDVTISNSGAIMVYSDDFYQDEIASIVAVLKSFNKCYTFTPMEINGKFKVVVFIHPDND